MARLSLRVFHLRPSFYHSLRSPFCWICVSHPLQWVLLETGSSLYLRWLVILWVVLAIRYNYIHVKMKSFPLWCQFMDSASTPQANLEQDHSSLLCGNAPNISNSIIFLSLDWKNSRLDNHKTNWERKKNAGSKDYSKSLFFADTCTPFWEFYLYRIITLFCDLITTCWANTPCFPIMDE